MHACGIEIGIILVHFGHWYRSLGRANARLLFFMKKPPPRPGWELDGSVTWELLGMLLRVSAANLAGSNTVLMGGWIVSRHLFNLISFLVQGES